MTSPDTGRVEARVRLQSPPERVFETLSTNAGRASFWADAAEERDGVIHFRFSNGMTHEGRILACDAPRRFAVAYFGGSRAEFSLMDDGSGGTDVRLLEAGIPAAWWAEHRAGWVSVLLALKARVDFGVDLRNGRTGCTWERGYVDV